MYRCVCAGVCRCVCACVRKYVLVCVYNVHVCRAVGAACAACYGKT